MNLFRGRSLRSATASLLVSAAALAAPRVHEYVEPDPAEDLRVAATTRDGRLPAALETQSGTVSAPDPNRSLDDAAKAYGGSSTQNSADASYRVDTNTTRPDVVRYDDPFVPTVTPFKRLYAYDGIDRAFELVVAPEHEVLTPLEIGGRAGPGDDQFYADLVVDLVTETAVRIPSVGPGARVLVAYTDPPVTGFSLRKDGAENWFVRSSERKRVRLVMQLAISRAAFGSDFADVSWATLERSVPRLPPGLSAATQSVLSEIGVSRSQSPRAAAVALVSYFRSFAPSEQRPTSSGADLYKDLSLSKKGVCRHRSYAFTITAIAAGIPARMVRNEAHAWVEVFDGSLWHRVDLGGAAGELQVDSDPNVPTHTPPRDPYSWPPNSESGAEMADRAASSGAQPGGAGSSAVAASSALPDPGALPLGPGASDAGIEGRPASDIEFSLPSSGPVHRGATLRVTGKVRSDGAPCARLRLDVALRSGARSTPLGSLGAGSDGAFDGVVTVPPGIELGQYEIVVSTPGDLRCGPGSQQ